jgi:hypothetical protein
MKSLSAAALFAVVMCAGCNTAPDPLASSKIRQHCVVQLRRDALGSAAPVPVSPETENMNGAEVAIGGTLKRVQADWILIGTEKVEYAIPMRSILCMKFELPAPAR